MSFLRKLLGNSNESELKRIAPIVAKINALEPNYQKMTDESLRDQTDLSSLFYETDPFLSDTADGMRKWNGLPHTEPAL